LFLPWQFGNWLDYVEENAKEQLQNRESVRFRGRSFPVPIDKADRITYAKIIVKARPKNCVFGNWALLKHLTKKTERDESTKRTRSIWFFYAAIAVVLPPLAHLFFKRFVATAWAQNWIHWCETGRMPLSNSGLRLFLSLWVMIGGLWNLALPPLVFLLVAPEIGVEWAVTTAVLILVIVASIRSWTMTKLAIRIFRPVELYAEDREPHAVEVPAMGQC